MSEPVTISDANFDEAVGKATTPVVVDFWAPWCRPCQMIAPILDELAKDYGDRIKVARLNVDENPKTAGKYGVMSIPTLIVFKQAKPATQIVGFRPKAELKKSIDSVLEKK